MMRTGWGRGRVRQAIRVGFGVSLLLFASVAVGCAASPKSRQDYLTQARIQVDQRLQGRWKLVSFIPESQLSPAVGTLLAFQNDRLVVEFQHGRVRSASPSVTFDRTYRIEDAHKIPFIVWLVDEQGVGYETVCEFDDGGRLHFHSITDPWKGRGVLEREGASLGAAPAPY